MAKDLRWTLKKSDSAIAQQLQEELKVHPSICEMLTQRGIHSFDDARDFFNPNLSQLHDPFLMQDMDKAVERITNAISKNEKLLIYGDYDVDGTTSVSLMVLFLGKFYPNIDFYIPNRYTEGYGISTQGIDFAKANDFSLIIALDCGIKSIDKIDYANQLGIDFIICDHHNPGEELPKAVAVLDPKRKDCAYPFKELSGCGVGFKLIQALSLHLDIDKNIYLELLDLVAVSIASDIVSLAGENRILAYFGLKKLNSNPGYGLKHLIQLIGFDKALDISDVVFYIGPRINAAGRMGDAKDSVKLLIADDSPTHAIQADELHQLNKQRQEADKEITESAIEMIENWLDKDIRKSTVVFKNGWHKGVIGIVASRLIETYYRPTIVLTEHEGKVTGSGRSVKDFDLYEAIYNCKDHLIQFGGHKFAAGLTMLPEKVVDFTKAFEEEVSKTITPEQLIPEIEIDAEISLDTITDKYFKIIKRFEPFGPDNMKPQFLVRNLQDTGWSKVVKEKHLKVSVKKGLAQLSGIGFNMAEKLRLLKEGEVDIVFQIEENEWHGQVSLQLMIKDIAKSGEKTLRD